MDNYELGVDTYMGTVEPFKHLLYATAYAQFLQTGGATAHGCLPETIRYYRGAFCT